jgi:uncharacterized protein YbjT (DUF2867 family)
MKTALVIGATGLVGKELVGQLLQDARFGKVIVFVRRAAGRTHAKLEEHLVDFDNPAGWKDLLRGDVLFSAMGTTIKKAGSKEAQYKIDYTYQYEAARAAAENGVPTYVLVSSAGASSSSRIFYSRMKGELEDAVKGLPFSYIRIIQPGILAGGREEFRLGERIGIAVMSVLGQVPGLTAYKPYQASVVARALIRAALYEEGRIRTYHLKEVFELAGEKV